jgi:phage tail sheath protein FI
VPVRTTYPGVYIEEVSSGVRTLTGVATSVAAFVGYTARGRDNRAIRLLSWTDFEREFGGLARDSELSYAVSHFYANGGGEAWVVRVPRRGAVAAAITAQDKVAAGPKAALRLTALSTGAAANGLVIDVYYDGVPDRKSYFLTVTDPVGGAAEKFLVSQESTASNYVLAVVNDPARGSRLVSAAVPDATAARPAQTGTSGSDIPVAAGGGFDLAVPLTLNVSASKPAGVIADVPVTVLTADDALPTSVLGLARLLERRINEQLALLRKGAAVRCEPNETGIGLRVWAEFDQALLPGTLDAVVTFKNSGNLRLNATAADANVAFYVLGQGEIVGAQVAPTPGTDGLGLPDATALIGSRGTNPPTGIFALEKVDLFNILCLPDATRPMPGDPTAAEIGASARASLLSAAMSYCRERRAFLIVDPPPDVDTVDAAADWAANDLTALNDPNGAAYFPRVRLADPLDGYALRAFAPSGVIAGLYARIDATSGVWKAPAGTEATLMDVRAPAYRLTDGENGVLNPLGVNCLRAFPTYGNVAWGARTLAGADELASEWKYIPVRRLALYLEESLYRGTKWAVFEPNDEPLWSQLRLNVGSFMNTLFRQGAFAGRSTREAYLVKCDRETTTQADVDRGVVNILVMFAPLKPAEFVVIRIQQMAGQLQV